MPDDHRWRGRDPADLTDDELIEASVFLTNVFEELKDWAPTHVWAYIAKVNEAITIEFVKRQRVRDGIRR